MSLIDFILNVAGLLLWLNWRAVPVPPGRRADLGPPPFNATGPERTP